MNNDDLLSSIDNFFGKDSSNEKVDKDLKKVNGGVVDRGQNSNLKGETVHPKSLFEIRDALERLNKIKSSIGDDKDYTIRDDVNEITSFLFAGLIPDEFYMHQEIIESIVLFLGDYGFSDEFVIDNLKDMKCIVQPLEALQRIKGYALGDHIVLDLDFFDYDKDGKIVGINQNMQAMYQHVVTHEFFHKLSSFKNGYEEKAVMGDALLEGFTDYFTKLTIVDDKVESDLYGVPTRVCEMFAEIMGVDKTLDDYINHTREFPNLMNLFNECGLDQGSFLEFQGKLDSVITSVSSDKASGIPKELWGKDAKGESISFLRENIIIPYCRNNPDKAGRILDKFNTLFEGKYSKTQSL